MEEQRNSGKKCLVTVRNLSVAGTRYHGTVTTRGPYRVQLFKIYPHQKVGGVSNVMEDEENRLPMAKASSIHRVGRKFSLLSEKDFCHLLHHIICKIKPDWNDFYYGGTQDLWKRPRPL
ncbi:hypothetical protein NPIL_378541 [Nephila pilipes]|uniref:Uncharacterized protein n=1 Tax=Nephila pilipes TaxID=299642 RepID=A0A8X6THT4_NEPPI|nr:hypothetical protein NPIL_378541 [Nephila pilipes]